MLTDLGTLPGGCYSEAFAINARGQVVGQSVGCDFSGGSVLWEHGSIVDLNTLIPRDSDLHLDNAFAISDRAEIAGFGLPSGCTLDTACGHGFLLIPCEGYSGDEGCAEHDEDATAANPHPPAAAKPSPTSLADGSLTPRGIAARMRARFSRRYLGRWPRQQAPAG